MRRNRSGKEKVDKSMYLWMSECVGVGKFVYACLGTRWCVAVFVCRCIFV